MLGRRADARELWKVCSDNSWLLADRTLPEPSARAAARNKQSASRERGPPKQSSKAKAERKQGAGTPQAKLTSLPPGDETHTDAGKGNRPQPSVQGCLALRRCFACASACNEPGRWIRHWAGVPLLASPHHSLQTPGAMQPCFGVRFERRCLRGSKWPTTRSARRRGLLLSQARSVDAGACMAWPSTCLSPGFVDSSTPLPEVPF